jgi:2-polyprenyl-6-methoxyphenol hydroxylase-like FAD-dependent oxidoreductase
LLDKKLMPETDVFVIGGGPAGLAAALAARRAGFRVAVADSERPPIDKACGEGLMPDSLEAAASLGISIPEDRAAKFRGIRFRGADNTVCADFPGGSGLGVRRTVLHPLMAGAAADAGVELLWGSPVTGLDANSVTVGGTAWKTRWIIGADGAQSLVRRWAGLQKFQRNTERFSFRRHYRVAPWSEYMEIHWGESAQFYVTPVSPGEVCVVLMSRDPHLRIDAALPKFPFLAARLAGGGITTSERGSIAATRKLKRVAAGNVALIGDASGTVDPITGEGLCLAFHQSVALAQALRLDDLDYYAQEHARICRRPRFMADFMLLLDRSANLRGRALAALAENPAIFADLLAMHVGKLKASRFAATAAHLGWEVLTA